MWTEPMLDKVTKPVPNVKNHVTAFYIVNKTEVVQRMESRKEETSF